MDSKGNIGSVTGKDYIDCGGEGKQELNSGWYKVQNPRAIHRSKRILGILIYKR